MFNVENEKELENLKGNLIYKSKEVIERTLTDHFNLIKKRKLLDEGFTPKTCYSYDELTELSDELINSSRILNDFICWTSDDLRKMRYNKETYISSNHSKHLTGNHIANHYEQYYLLLNIRLKEIKRLTYQNIEN
jgi:hypothetical protein